MQGVVAGAAVAILVGRRPAVVGRRSAVIAGRRRGPVISRNGIGLASKPWLAR
jgi:hypothetical protein